MKRPKSVRVRRWCTRLVGVLCELVDVCGAVFPLCEVVVGVVLWAM